MSTPRRAHDGRAWALRLDTAGDGLRVAVKDLIDMAGLPTTAGCQAVAERAGPAADDAACLAGIRAAEASGEIRIVGKTTLHELALGITGVNLWAGTAVNPAAPDRVPGGSSSGSATAVAAGEADVALGTDTGGSVRIPAACCGIAGLKTTWGRIPTAGVRDLAPSLDTVGPMARDVAGLVAGMDLLEPGFAIDASHLGAPASIGRVRLSADGRVDGAVDAALAASGYEVVDIDLPGWQEAGEAALTALAAEAWLSIGGIVTTFPDQVGADVVARIREAEGVSAADLARARLVLERWRVTIGGRLARFDALALPTLLGPPPVLEEAGTIWKVRGLTTAVNAAGLPALALPLPAPELPVPASLQLIGPRWGEERLLALGLRIEAAAAA